MNPHRNILPLIAASVLGMAVPVARPGRGCVQSVESIRRGIAKRRARTAAKSARRRNRK